MWGYFALEVDINILRLQQPFWIAQSVFSCCILCFGRYSPTLPVVRLLVSYLTKDVTLLAYLSYLTCGLVMTLVPYLWSGHYSGTLPVVWSLLWYLTCGLVVTLIPSLWSGHYSGTIPVV